MKKLQSAFEEYLNLIGQQGGSDLGGETRPEVTAHDNERFAGLLDEHLKFNKGLIVVAVTLLCVLFVMGMFLVYTLRASPRSIVIISGGSFLSFLIIIRWLRQLWIEKSMMDILLYAARDMPPKEAAKFLTGFYFKMLHPDRGARGRSRSQGIARAAKTKDVVRLDASPK